MTVESNFQDLALKLSDALRSSTDPEAIQASATRVFGEHLGVSRALYCEVVNEDGAECYRVGPHYCAAGMSKLADRLHAEDFGPRLSHEFHSGHAMVSNDVASDAQLGERERSAYAAIDTRAFAAAPLIKHGRHVAFFSLQQNVPRTWNRAELALLTETAERTWSAVERARAEASVHESDARLQLALDAANMGTFVWYMHEDRCEPDARMLALFGLPKDGVLNLAVALEALIHPDDRSRYAQAVQAAAVSGGTGRLREDIRVLHPDGSMHWIAITAQMVFDNQPHQPHHTSRPPLRLVGMANDISARKATEEALRKSEERFRDIDRHKDEFLAVLAHELRNPLAPIRTGLELIRLAGDKPEAIERVRGMMERQIIHMVRLIDDLLDVSRINSGKIRLQRQRATLSTLINTAVEANRTALNAGQLALSVVIPAAPIVLDVDPTRFVQIISNLLHNAIKFTRAQGKIRIAAGIEAQGDGHSEQLSLNITDSGIGIAAATLPRVFELFVQGDLDAHDKQPGLGIGLALARRLIELHGGTVEAASEGPGKGSAFTLRLPLPAQHEDPAATKPNAQAGPFKRRVVVIDDNEDSADTMAMFLTALGSEASVAYDGEAGLARVLDARPDLVLLDIGMPGIDGYETCRRIRHVLGDAVVVVAMTGWGQERDKQEATSAGFDAHLTKPVDPAMLKRLLADCGCARVSPRSSSPR